MGLRSPIHNMPRLIWTQTGDTVSLDPLNHAVYDYFVDQLSQHSVNRYTMEDLRFGILSAELAQLVKAVKQIFKTRLQSSAFDFDFDFSNQTHLNSLHRTWVKVHQQYPQIGKLFDTQIPGGFDRINKLIHAIEELTNCFELTSQSPNFAMPNPFGSEVLQHGVFNVSIAYNNLGRNSYTKWLNYDAVLDSDLNNFDEFYTSLIIKIMPTCHYALPAEYVQWCNTNDIPCVGNQMPLANFDKLESNLLQYKQTFYKNSLIENNFITLE